jgi:non-ribosomal peptide synthetase component E (peptide arylation enzyme)
MVDEAGETVPADTEGDIAYRGPTHMLGYLGKPDETKALYTPEGFSRSGDLGAMDADGYVRVTGRTKDIVIRGGMNISVREVEDLLAAHSGIRFAAVIGMLDERLGERVCCYVVPADVAEPRHWTRRRTTCSPRASPSRRHRNDSNSSMRCRPRRPERSRSTSFARTSPATSG